MLGLYQPLKPYHVQIKGYLNHNGKDLVYNLSHYR